MKYKHKDPTNMNFIGSLRMNTIACLRSKLSELKGVIWPYTRQLIDINNYNCFVCQII